MGLNLVAISGNLTADPELKYLPSGTPIAEFSVAVNEVFYSGEEGKKEKREKTHFIRCTAFGKIAESISNFFMKGKPIIVQGRLVQETWDDRTDGKKREKTKVAVESWEFAGGDKKPAGAVSSKPDADPDAE